MEEDNIIPQATLDGDLDRIIEQTEPVNNTHGKYPFTAFYCSLTQIHSLWSMVTPFIFIIDKIWA